MIKQNQRGFTIIELLIATTVFSVILLVASAAVIQVGRIYYKGVTMAKTQEITRSLGEEVTRSLQFEKRTNFKCIEVNEAGVTTCKKDTGAYCVGLTRYTFATDKVFRTNLSNGHAVWVDRIQSAQDPCDAVDLSAASPSNSRTDTNYPGRELMSENMRLLDFSIVPLGDGTGSFGVNIKIAYGDNDQLTTYDNAGVRNTAVPLKDGLCKLESGSNFCATAQLDTTVKSRIN